MIYISKVGVICAGVIVSGVIEIKADGEVLRGFNGDAGREGVSLQAIVSSHIIPYPLYASSQSGLNDTPQEGDIGTYLAD